VLLLLCLGKEVVDSLQDSAIIDVESLRVAERFTTDLDCQILCTADSKILDLIGFDHHVLDGHIACVVEC
jgi:hypothetical protein